MISTPSGGDTLPIQEQLQLFSSNHSPLSALHGKTRKHHALSKRQRLSALLQVSSIFMVQTAAMPRMMFTHSPPSFRRNCPVLSFAASPLPATSSSIP